MQFVKLISTMFCKGGFLILQGGGQESSDGEPCGKVLEEIWANLQTSVSSWAPQGVQMPSRWLSAPSLGGCPHSNSD